MGRLTKTTPVVVWQPQGGDGEAAVERLTAVSVPIGLVSPGSVVLVMLLAVSARL